MQVTVCGATPADLGPLSDVLASAFHDDPVTRWLLPEARRVPAWFRTIVRHLHLPNAATDLGHLDGRLAAVAVWDPPGWRTPPARHVMAVAPGLLRTMGRRVRMAIEVQYVMARARPVVPHWYLAFLGTEPELRGAGVGSALLRARLARCDEQGVGAYLESSKESTVSYYQRFGFTVTAELVLNDGGPATWAMWRDPR